MSVLADLVILGMYAVPLLPVPALIAYKRRRTRMVHASLQGLLDRITTEHEHRNERTLFYGRDTRISELAWLHFNVIPHRRIIGQLHYAFGPGTSPAPQFPPPMPPLRLTPQPFRLRLITQRSSADAGADAQAHADWWSIIEVLEGEPAHVLTVLTRPGMTQALAALLRLRDPRHILELSLDHDALRLILDLSAIPKLDEQIALIEPLLGALHQLFAALRGQPQLDPAHLVSRLDGPQHELLRSDLLAYLAEHAWESLPEHARQDIQARRAPPPLRAAAAREAIRSGRPTQPFEDDPELIEWLMVYARMAYARSDALAPARLRRRYTLQAQLTLLMTLAAERVAQHAQDSPPALRAAALTHLLHARSPQAWSQLVTQALDASPYFAPSLWSALRGHLELPPALLMDALLEHLTRTQEPLMGDALAAAPAEHFGPHHESRLLAMAEQGLHTRSALEALSKIGVGTTYAALCHPSHPLRLGPHKALLQQTLRAIEARLKHDPKLVGALELATEGSAAGALSLTHDQGALALLPQDDDPDRPPG